MNRFVLTLVLACISACCFSQIKAVTENGEEVLLYADGTWKYANAHEADSAQIINVNPGKFAKSANATFLVKSTKTDFGFYIDTKKWQFNKAENNAAAEYEMELKGKDLYAMAIAEKIEIPVENLVEIAVGNAKEAAPDITVVKKEYRMVNGKKVIMMQMNGTTHGIKFSYVGYYYSTPSGSVQYVVYTSQQLLKEYMPDIEELLNGLVVLEK